MSGEKYSPPTLLDYRGVSTAIVGELAMILKDMAGKDPEENRRMLRWLRETFQKALTNVASHTADRCRDVVRNTEFSQDEAHLQRTDFEKAIATFGGPEANERQRFDRLGKSAGTGDPCAEGRAPGVWEGGTGPGQRELDQIETGRRQVAAAKRSYGR